MGLAKRRPQERDWSIGDPAFAAHLGLQSYTGENVDEARALGVAALYRALSIKAGSIASLTLRGVKESKKGWKEDVPTWLDNPYGPDDARTQHEWVETIVLHQELHGNAFLWLLRNDGGAVVGAVPIHPCAVRVEEEVWLDGNGFRQRELKFFISQDKGGELEANEDEVLHLPGMSTNGITGISLLDKARNSIGIALAGEKSAGTVMKNGPHNTMLVSPKENLNSTQRTAVAESLKQVQGPDQAGKMFLFNQALTMSPFTMSYADAQFLETRIFQIEEISRWTGVPPHLLGLTEKQTSWGTGVAEQNQGLARYVLMPITNRLEQRLTKQLPNKVKAEFNYKGFIKPSPEKEIELVIQEVRDGLLTPNEGRQIIGYEHIPGEDVLRIPPGSPPKEGDDMNGNPQDSQTT